MKIKTIIPGLFLVGLIAFWGCGNGNGQESEGFETSETGVVYKFYVDEEGEQPRVGDFVILNMEYGPRDSMIFSSKMTGGTSGFQIGEPTFTGDLFEGLTMLSPGDSATFVMSADSFYMHRSGRKPPPSIKPGSDLYFNVKLIEFEKLEDLEAEEAVLTNAYLDKNNLETEPDEDGIYFIEFDQGKGKNIEAGDMVSLHYAVYLLDSTKLFSTFEGNRPRDIKMGSKFDTEGMNLVLEKMNMGGKAKFIIPSRLAFGDKGLGQAVKPYAPIMYNIEVIDVKTQEEYEKDRQANMSEDQKKMEVQSQRRKAQEPFLIKQYLEENNIDVQPTASGLYFISIKEGWGKKPKDGDQVTVHYTLYDINGKKLQSSRDMMKPFKFTVGKGEVIKAWDEALPMIKEGGKARIIAPSKIAYGANGAGRDILPYSPLIFEIDLIQIAK